MDHPVALVIAIQERSLAEKLRGQEMFRGAARSMGYIAALLSHEIKTRSPVSEGRRADCC